MKPSSLSPSEIMLLQAFADDNPGSRLSLKLAAAHRAEGDLGQAAQVLEAFLALHPRDVESRELLAQVLLDDGRENSALDQLNRAAEQLRSQAGVFQSLGRILRRKGQTREAIQAEEAYRALTLGDDQAGNAGGAETITLAEIYAAQGYADQAAAIYRQLAAKNPGDKRLKTRLEELEQAAGKRASILQEEPPAFEAVEAAMVEAEHQPAPQTAPSACQELPPLDLAEPEDEPADELPEWDASESSSLEPAAAAEPLPPLDMGELEVQSPVREPGPPPLEAVVPEEPGDGLPPEVPPEESAGDWEVLPAPVPNLTSLKRQKTMDQLSRFREAALKRSGNAA